MGGPYLESGESIVMTADRVSVGSIAYDAILTTRRLILIDQRNTRLEPRILLLSTIESVQSGKAATGDPVIILTFQKQDDHAAENQIIIFSQEPLENRKQDRDLWIQKFIEHSISVKEEEFLKDTTPVYKPEGMHPSTRRWVAPEIIRPHTDKYRVPAEVPGINIIPDETEPIQIPAAKQKPADLSLTEGDEENGGNRNQDFLTRATQAAVQSIIVPEFQVSIMPHESGTPETEMLQQSGISPSADIPVFPTPLPDTPSPLSLAILAATRSLTAQKERDNAFETLQVPVQTEIRMTSPLPEIPVSLKKPEPVQEPDKFLYFTPIPRDIRDPSLDEEMPGVVRNTSLLPVIHANSLVPKTLSELPTQQVTDGPEPVISDNLSEHVSIATVQDHERKSEGLSPAPAEISAPLPRRAPHVGTNSLLVACGLVLLLVYASIAFLPGMLPLNNGPATPIVPALVPTMAPSLTPTSVPVTIPQEGVWVRIVSTGYYIGQVGNPGSLQQISGSSEKFYKIRDSRDIVKVSVEKQEYTGDELLVEIYKDGRMISSRSVTAPMGSVDLLIDPNTENPPGLITTRPTGNTTGTGKRQLEYY
jgi:hypothetical protein